MSHLLQIHPVNPQPRLIAQAVERLRAGEVIVYPTDSSYALGCQLGDKAAAERIRHIRQTDRHHNFTLVCRDLSEIATYAKVDNSRYRLLKAATPGPFTFICRRRTRYHAACSIPAERALAFGCRTTPLSAPCWRCWANRL